MIIWFPNENYFVIRRAGSIAAVKFGSPRVGSIAERWWNYVIHEFFDIEFDRETFGKKKL